MTTPLELERLSAAVHDESFVVERMEHDADRAELRLPIDVGGTKGWLLERTRPPVDAPRPARPTLVVRQVTGVSVGDETDIGWHGIWPSRAPLRGVD